MSIEQGGSRQLPLLFVVSSGPEMLNTQGGKGVAAGPSHLTLGRLFLRICVVSSGPFGGEGEERSRSTIQLGPVRCHAK